jgi:hypothetical protein
MAAVASGGTTASVAVLSDGSAERGAVRVEEVVEDADVAAERRMVAEHAYPGDSAVVIDNIHKACLGFGVLLLLESSNR